MRINNKLTPVHTSWKLGDFILSEVGTLYRVVLDSFGSYGLVHVQSGRMQLGTFKELATLQRHYGRAYDKIVECEVNITKERI